MFICDGDRIEGRTSPVEFWKPGEILNVERRSRLMLYYKFQMTELLSLCLCTLCVQDRLLFFGLFFCECSEETSFFLSYEISAGTITSAWESIQYSQREIRFAKKLRKWKT